MHRNKKERGDMEIQHFSHEHPLVLVEEQSHESDGDEKACCSGCGELVSGPCFSCVACGFHLDKKCAEASSELNHPFHSKHNFDLLKRHPYEGGCYCNFCGKRCENFVYHCSCNLDLHIKCGLLSYKIAEKKLGELQHISHIDPALISMENCNIEELQKAECFVCWMPLLGSKYLSADCGFYMHERCVDLPAEINLLWHPQHSLVLQFNSEGLPCAICQKTQRRGFVYRCSHCEFVLDIECSEIPTKLNHLCYHKHPLLLQFKTENLPVCQICQNATHKQVVYCCSICDFSLHVGCASPPSTIVDKNHQHPFLLHPRHVSFICDACGTQGNYVSYICSPSGIIVHKDCISLPRIIKFCMHPHRLLHTYFLGQHDQFEMWECRYCHEEVNTEYGGYFCSKKCKFIVHAKCATKFGYLYFEVDSTETDDEEEEVDLMENGKHLSHQHVLHWHWVIRLRILISDVRVARYPSHQLLIIIVHNHNVISFSTSLVPPYL